MQYIVVVSTNGYDDLFGIKIYWITKNRIIGMGGALDSSRSENILVNDFR
jgi:malate/lactate dehydrogenase